MKKQANRKAILISAVLTMMLLTFVGGTAFAAKRIFAQPQQTPAADIAQQAIPAGLAQKTVLQTANAAPVDTTNNQSIAAYQAQLEQAYQALNEAYAQIDTLQAAQAQAPAPSFFGDDEHDEHQREGQFLRNGAFVLRLGETDHD